MGDHLPKYVTDHMAGSVAALELLERLKDAHAGEPVAATAAWLIDQINGERVVLDGLAERLGTSLTAPRKAAAWLAEKAIQLKLLYDDPQGGPFRLHESLEGLSLGVEGKRLLWRALSRASSRRPELAGPDYDALVAAAEEQRRRLEVHRLDAAGEAFAGEPA